MPGIESKKILRKKFQQLRNNQSDIEKKNAAINAARLFLDNFSTETEDIIGAYYPANNEISTLPLLEKLCKNGSKTALPVMQSLESPLEFQSWQYGDNLQESKFFKIQEPNNIPVIPNIIIVPLLAFDNKMNRLGYGGGFYDRTIENLKKTKYDFISIGYAYSFQQTNEVPINDKDAPLDYIITEREILQKTSSF